MSDKCPKCGDPGGDCESFGLVRECLRRQIAQKDARIAELEAIVSRTKQEKTDEINQV